MKQKKDAWYWFTIFLTMLVVGLGIWLTTILFRGQAHAAACASLLATMFAGLMGYGELRQPFWYLRLNARLNGEPLIPLARVVVSGPEHNPTFRYEGEPRSYARLPLTTEKYKDDDDV